MTHNPRAYCAGVGTVLLVIGLTVAWRVAAPDQPTPNPGEASIRIVPGRASDPPAEVSVKAAGSILTANAVPDMAQLTVNERAEVLESRPRDAAWSTQTEAALLAQLRRSDVIPGVIRCADTLCSVQGTINAVAPADRQQVVDQLVRGRLHAVYNRAGLASMQAMSIEADDAGTLHITEYLCRE